MHETQASIVKWVEETFGPPSSLISVATRANEELAELLHALSSKDREAKAHTECADVTIVLFRLADRVQHDLKASKDEGRATVQPYVKDSLTRATALQCALLAQRHMCVLLEHLAMDVDTAFVAARINSICGCLAYCAHLLGRELDDLIDNKMGLNRARKWETNHTGHGYHVKTPGEIDEHGNRYCARPRAGGNTCIYSRAIGQPRPRLCIGCKAPEPEKDQKGS